MPFLDPNAVISEAKLTQYLLVPLEKDDKSQFLALAGYALNNWQQLEKDIRQILFLETTLTQDTRYGQKYAIVGTLTGPNEVALLNADMKCPHPQPFSPGRKEPELLSP
ncbi:MAG: hypothetical protein LH660_06845, partial [Phormidesmis sp. CAN_BIN36]|nr:hypothetical protein [Phormidesmis sp. CAN_BIN36]